MTVVGKNIDRLIKDRRISQHELARMAGVTQPLISYLVNGSTQAGRPSTLIKIAGALGVSVADLWREEKTS